MAGVSIFRIVLVFNGRSRHDNMQIASDWGGLMSTSVS